MMRTLRLEEPEGLKVASSSDARWVIPFTWEVGLQRRSLESRALVIRYKPQPEDPSEGAGHDPFEWMRSLASSSPITVATPTSRPMVSPAALPRASLAPSAFPTPANPSTTHLPSARPSKQPPPTEPRTVPQGAEGGAASGPHSGSSSSGSSSTSDPLTARSSPAQPQAEPQTPTQSHSLHHAQHLQHQHQHQPPPPPPLQQRAQVQEQGTGQQQHLPPGRSPSDSYLELVYPFSSSPAFKEQYRLFFSNHMRFGLLLEDLDSLAGDIAARHAGMSGRVLLTASIDHISWLHDPSLGEITMEHDLRVAGQVIWAGRSSMQVQVELSRRDGAGGPGRPWTFIGFAVFVLVARTPDHTAGAQVPPLVPRTARERELFECGKEHVALRRQRRESHWARKPPTPDEVLLLHDLIRNHHLHRTAAHHHHQSQAGAVPMARTVLHSSYLMHSQDRNAWNVIFGGHLLRLAYEHAFTTAALHAGEYCDAVSMDDVAFLLPVPIGALLRLTAQVVYTEGPVLRVHVRASKVEPGAPELSVVTNVFSFAFCSSSGPVRRVVPEAMVEALEYLQGHRQHNADASSHAIVVAARSRL